MLNNREIRVQEPIHTILRTALLALFELPAAYAARYAFLPAYIRQIMNSYPKRTVSTSSTRIHLEAESRRLRRSRSDGCRAVTRQEEEREGRGQ